MNRAKYYNTSETGLALGLTRQTVAEAAEKLGIKGDGLGLPGRAVYYTPEQVRQIGRAFRVKPDFDLVGASSTRETVSP